MTMIFFFLSSFFLSVVVVVVGILLLLASDYRLTFLATVVSELRNSRTGKHFRYSLIFQTVNTT